jgi:hypothetical protein
MLGPCLYFILDNGRSHHRKLQRYRTNKSLRGRKERWVSRFYKSLGRWYWLTDALPVPIFSLYWFLRLHFSIWVRECTVTTRLFYSSFFNKMFPYAEERRKRRSGAGAGAGAVTYSRHPPNPHPSTPPTHRYPHPSTPPTHRYTRPTLNPTPHPHTGTPPPHPSALPTHRYIQ